MPAGRPSDYDPKILPDVAEMSEAGATDEQIADSIGIDRTTLYRWRHRYPEFRDALKDNKEIADRRVELTLYQKALAGDTTAMIFWLKNRKSREWRDKSEVEVPGLTALAERLAEARKRLP